MREPGVYEISDEEYHADALADVPSLSRSVANVLVEKSPAHARYMHPRLSGQGETKSSAAMTLGKLAHRLLLGKGATVAVWEGDNWRKKAAQEFRDTHEAAGEIAVTQPQYEKALELVTVAAHHLGNLGKFEAERTWLAEDANGTLLRCRTDIDINGGAKVIDYKTTSGSADPLEGAPKLIANSGYDFQHAFYERVITELRPDFRGRFEFQLLIQEVYPPYELSFVSASEADVEIARRRVDLAVDLWRDCLERNEWPGYPKDVQRVTLPTWRQAAWINREIMRDEGVM